MAALPRPGGRKMENIPGRVVVDPEIFVSGNVISRMYVPLLGSGKGVFKCLELLQSHGRVFFVLILR